jgi:hypothetical protein
MWFQWEGMDRTRRTFLGATQGVPGSKEGVGHVFRLNAVLLVLALEELWSNNPSSKLRASRKVSPWGSDHKLKLISIASTEWVSLPTEM